MVKVFIAIVIALSVACASIRTVPDSWMTVEVSTVFLQGQEPANVEANVKVHKRESNHYLLIELHKQGKVVHSEVFDLQQYRSYDFRLVFKALSAGNYLLVAKILDLDKKPVLFVGDSVCFRVLAK